MKLRKLAAPLAATALALSAAGAQAGVTEINTGLDLMTQYNLITFGDFKAGHDVEGRAFIGGDVTGSSATFYNNPSSFGVNPGPSNPGLTVVGDVKGDTKNLNNGAGALIGGSVDNQFNLNGVQTVNVGGTLNQVNLNGSTVNQNVPGLAASLAATEASYYSTLNNLSQELSALTKTVDYALVGSNEIHFELGAPSGSEPAVYFLESTDVLNGRNITFDIGAYDFVVVNVKGSAPVLPSGTNWNGGDDASTLGANVIWNFYEATTIGFNGQFKGSVLAPNAIATFSNSPITGTAVFAEFNQGGEVHMANFGGYTFTPPPGVPEPATWAMMILGFGAAGSMIRRRRAVFA